VSQSEHGGMENGDNSFNVTGIDRTASAIGRTAFENQKSYPTIDGPEDIPMDTQSNHSKTSRARSQGAHTTRSEKSATLSKKEREPKKKTQRRNLRHLYLTCQYQKNLANLLQKK